MGVIAQRLREVGKAGAWIFARGEDIPCSAVCFPDGIGNLIIVLRHLFFDLTKRGVRFALVHPRHHPGPNRQPCEDGKGGGELAQAGGLRTGGMRRSADFGRCLGVQCLFQGINRVFRVRESQPGQLPVKLDRVALSIMGYQIRQDGHLVIWNQSGHRVVFVC